ncbi:hypothetical protein ONZ45_g5130 [Pleurotus djamor]|nr:hypothetical protein ONZ45_g5130 [Pleurotus djamor]
MAARLSISTPKPLHPVRSVPSRSHSADAVLPSPADDSAPSSSPTTTGFPDDDDVTLQNANSVLTKTSSIRTSTSSNTYAPSVALSRSNSVTQHKFKSTTALPDSSPSDAPSRIDLNAALGADMIPHTTELTSLPCAGLRIAHGPLTGLMAWKFVVQVPRAPSKPTATPQPILPFASEHPAVVTNFILDTGSLHSVVPPETLHALGYNRPFSAGSEVKLIVQGVLVNFTVAPMGDAGRLSSQFMVAASLALYFDPRIVAPVLFFPSHDARARDIPTTVPSPPSLSLKQLIAGLMHFGRRSES